MSAPTVLGAGVCPYCLLPGCTREHPDCSPPPAKRQAEPRAQLHRRCTECGERLATPCADGRCGFCIEEAEL